MEKLIVKNFGPIKHAEVDLTKYIVFIGDTSTGKSVLAKLITIFRDSFQILQVQKGLESLDFTKELKKYNINFDISNAEIVLFDTVFNSNEIVKVLVLENSRIKLINSEIKEKFLEFFDDLQVKTIEKSNFPDFIDFNREKFNELFFRDFFKSVGSTYFPAERVLYSLTGNSLSGIMANNVSLPECYKDFAAKYEVARKEIVNINYLDFELKYNFKNGLDVVEVNNTSILLSESSSGIQSLIPLLIVLEYEINMEKKIASNILVIEEPELNLYPIKQKKLVEHIIQKVNDKDLDIVITTHSPYILSALDTLMLAKNTFDEHQDLKEEINAIVSEDKWIAYDDISVYEVRNDGKVYSIKNAEFRSIDTNAIDKVSDIISEEFDKLTELRYAH